MVTNPFIRLIQDLTLWGMERFHKYYSSYRGFVYDRDDPEGMGRLQLYVPHLYATEPYKVWAFPVGIPSGFGYGLHWIPLKGEMVWVEFEGGDPKKPLWKFGHFGRSPQGDSEIPPHLNDPDVYWLRTPGGLGIEFNDKTLEIKLIGSSITHESTGSTIKVGSNLVEITDSGVNITAGDGSKVYLNGKNPILYSKAPFADSILDLKEIGVSTSVRVGG